MPYLFQVSIGPVQPFIAGARRTRDLKFSSSFLSSIARAVVARMTRENDASTTLIFPARRDLDDVPNKILVYTSRAPQDLAREAKEALEDRVEGFWKQVLSSIGDDVPFRQDEAKQQVSDLVEHIWAAVEFDQQQDDYNQARRLLEALMAARKNTRDFAPVSWGSEAPKSSLDGALEGVLPEEVYPSGWERIAKVSSPDEQKRLKAEYRAKVEALHKHFGAKPHEKLSGVDLLKRRGPIPEEDASPQDERQKQEKPATGGEGTAALTRGSENGQEHAAAGESTKTQNPEAFPSTSHIAALPFLRALHTLTGEERQKAVEWREQYRAALLEINQTISFLPDTLPKDYQNNTYWPDIFSLGIYDGAMLFPERFPDIVDDTQGFQEARKGFQKATKLLEDFFRAIQLRPNPYYVLLAADGDAMGTTIDWQARGVEGMRRHRELSLALASFAAGVRSIVRQHAGVRIYSGGDDVLALLPLHTAAQCARELAQSFHQELRPFQNQSGASPTLSVGLAVVHHLHPLGDALEIARAAEGRAKSGGKNALAITVQKRGGPPCTVSGRWGMFDQRLEQQIDLYRRGIIPSGMAYELEELALHLEPELAHAAGQPVSQQHVQYAALRVFQRKLSEVPRGGHDAQTIASTLDQLKGMIGLEHIQPVPVGQLANELVVARLFANVRLLAEGKG